MLIVETIARIRREHFIKGVAEWLILDETGATSGLGQSHHFERAPLTSGTPTPDILSARRHVSKVPTGDIAHNIETLFRLFTRHRR
jgi:hypothetical protein